MKEPLRQLETEEDAASHLGDLLLNWNWSWIDTAGWNDEILRLAHSYPSTFARVYRSSHFSTDMAYPIMILFAGRRNVSLETIAAVYDAFPPAVRARDRKGDLPIHEACKSGASVDVVQFLHQKYPDSALIRGRVGLTPLHWACFSEHMDVGNTRKVRSYLIDACPKAALEPSRDGHLPLHTVLHNKQVSSWYRAETLRELLRVAPSAASVKGSFEDIPLKVVLNDRSFSNDTKLTLVRDFLDAYPQAATEVVNVPCLWAERDSWDSLLIVLGYHMQQVNGKSPGYPSLYPLHAILHFYHRKLSNKFCLSEFIRKSCKELNRLDDSDCLPLHIALQRAQKELFPSSSMIQEMLELSPRTPLVRDPVTGLYPFMLAAAETVWQERAPESWSQVQEVQWLGITYQCFRIEPLRFLSRVASA